MKKTEKTIKQINFKTLAYDPNKPRNRADYLKWLSDGEVRKYLAGRKLNYGILLVNILYDNNAGNIVRSGNAFGAREIILYGHRKFDRRSSVGAEFYLPFRQVKFVEDLDEVFADYDLAVALENLPDALPLQDFRWSLEKKTLLVFGQESGGLPREIRDRCHQTVQIVQFGSVRSLNVATAAGIVLYDYCQKVGALDKFKTKPTEPIRRRTAKQNKQN